MIEIKNHQVVIDGVETFLYGAEFHYFRADRAVWEERLQQIRDAGFNLVSTYVPWIWHEGEENACDLTGQTHERRDLEYFLSLCHRMGLYCIVRPGPYVMSELQNAGIPTWLLKSYPQTLARDKEGRIHPTDVISYLHEDFLRLVERWYRKVCAVIAPHLITRGGSVIMFQLDNEIGMLHWVSNTSDYSAHSLEYFAQFLQKRYGEVSAAHMALGTRGEDFSAIAQQLVHASPDSLKTHWIWIDYRRQYAVDYVKVLRHYARQFGITVPFIVNVHGFKDFSIYSRGTDYPIGLSQLRDVSQFEDVVVAGDFYPGHIGYDNFHDLVLSSVFTESISHPDQVLFSAEFQSGRLADRPRIYPQDIDLITRICVSQGMNALNYYMFCGGDNVGDIGLFGARHEWQAPIASTGALRPSYQTAQYLGRLYQTWGHALSQAKKMVDLTIGFYSPYYATETVARDQPSVQTVIKTLEGHREHFHFDGVWRVLITSNVSINAVELQTGAWSPASHPTLWVATTPYMDADTQRRLVEFAKAGGHLIMGPDLPAFDLQGVPCTILADAIGAEANGRQVGKVVDVLGIAQVFCSYYHEFNLPSHATVFIRGQADAAAGFEVIHGQGRVSVIGVAFSHQYDYYQEIMRRLIAHFGIIPTMQTSDNEVLVSVRRGNAGSFVSIINSEDVTHRTIVYHKGKPAFGGRPVQVVGSSGKLLPMHYTLQKGLILDYSTVEIRDVQIFSDRVTVTLSIPAGDEAHVRWQVDLALWRFTAQTDVIVASEQPDLMTIEAVSWERQVPVTFMAAVAVNTMQETVS